MLLTLAWRNLWRNRSRTFITMASVFFAVMLSVITSSLQNGVFDNLIKNVVGFYSGYVQVHRKGYWDEKVIDNSLTITNHLNEILKSDDEIKMFSPRLESFALVSSGDKTVGGLVAGIIPENEKILIRLKEKVAQGIYLSQNDAGAMIGSGLAEKLNLKLNDTVLVLGQGYHGSLAAGKYAIQTILKFGSPELNNKVLLISFKQAQLLFSADSMANTVVLQLKNENDFVQIKNSLAVKLGSNYEVMTWEEMMPDVIQHIKTDKGSMFIIIGILYLLVAFGIFSTMLMLMAERKFELGMLLAIGMKRKSIALMLLAEALFTAFTGCIAGVAASIPLVYYFNIHPIKFGGEVKKLYEKFGFEAIFPTSTDPSIFIRQGIIVLIIAVVLFMYPLVKVKSMKVVNAMRK